MKYYTLLVFTLFFAFIGSDCKKRPFDDRNQYIGTWHFTYLVITNQLGQPQNEQSGSHIGRIFYNGKKDKNGSLWMEYAEGKTQGFELKNKRELFGCGEKNGEFHTRNSLTVISVPVHGCNYGLANKTTFTITADRPD